MSRIVHKREFEGRWWAERDDGSWTPWDSFADDWAAPQDPPSELMHKFPRTKPDEQGPGFASMAPAAVSAKLGPSGPLENPSPLDAWWNRAFPPFSAKRLIFGLLAVPIIASIDAFVRHLKGHDVPLAQTVVVVIMCWLVLALVWFVAAPKRDAEGKQLPRPSPAPTHPTSLTKDFAQSLPIAVAGMTLTLVFSGGWHDLSLASVGIAVLAAALLAAMITLRHTVWSTVLLSVAGGFLGALALDVVSLMTFSDPGNFYTAWLLCSLLLFVFLVPAWWLFMRRGFAQKAPSFRTRQRWGMREVPAWALTALAVVPLILISLISRVG